MITMMIIKSTFMFKNINYILFISRSKKAGRFEKLLGFARIHSIVARDSVSLSCATTPHPAFKS